MGRRDLLDKYVRSPRAEGIYIRQIPTAHVINDIYIRIYIYIYVCVCVCVCMYICMYVCMYVSLPAL